MDYLRILTASEQLAVHLRKQLIRGTWREFMPGELQLAAQLGVGRDTVKEALKLLEREGILVPQGVGKQRRIALREQDMGTPTLKVEILLYEALDRKADYFGDLKHRLRDVGHIADFSSKTLTGLGMDVKRVARFVESKTADAWIVVAGSGDVLKWFSDRGSPCFALYGRSIKLPLPRTYPKKSPAMIKAIRLLIAQGHQRIVMLSREERRKPEPGFLERVFLNELEAHGIATSSYNLPDWKESANGLNRAIDNLFRYTPPTALIVGQPPIFLAVRQHLAQRGILVPRDVSMICTDPDPGFDWYEPQISHIRWDTEPILRRVLQWVDNVAHGREDRKVTSSKATFVEGGTIGPAK
jgi:DNA-binding LacI/PurR family transcriptional regulator/biotin operon repressor